MSTRISSGIYEYNAPIDRMLRRVFERDSMSYPAQKRLEHRKMLGVVDEPVQPEPDTPFKFPPWVHMQIENRSGSA